jgi:hypothetical protein
MSKRGITISAEGSLNAPAEVVYHCLADYREHHRPGGFLPPQFVDFQIERGGVGAGTVISFATTLGGRKRRLTQQVSEPLPGRVLVESGEGVMTTFTVEPQGDGCRVRFDSVFEARGINALLMRLFAPRLLRPVYADEIRRLEQHARAHGPVPAAI